MRIVADENIEVEIIEHLRSLSYEVFSIGESLSGIDDEKVLEEANKINSILLTQDKDFGELVYRMKLVSSGVILLRLADIKPIEKALILCRVLEKYFEKLNNHFTVVNQNAIRIRNL